MIKFDPSKVSFHIVRLKTVTTALGGSINIVDTENSVGNKEKYFRIEVPLAVARSYIKAHDTTRYLVAIPACLTVYDGRVVAIEPHPLAGLAYDNIDDPNKTVLDWKPKSVIYYEKHIEAMLADWSTKQGVLDWYFDGRYVYTFAGANLTSNQDVIDAAPSLTQDRLFRRVDAVSIDLMGIYSEAYLVPEMRTCIAFVAPSGEFCISPPVWKEIETVGTAKLEKAGAADTNFRFDSIDENLAVNLNFALKAGNQLSKLFGFEIVEPLQFARLMIELHTVNLPNVAKEIKATTDIGLSFTHTIAWLLGLLRRVKTLDSFIVIRQLLKYLTTKGIFTRNTFSKQSIFVDPSITDVPIITQQQYQYRIDTGEIALSEIVGAVREHVRKDSQLIVNAIGELHTDYIDVEGD